MTLMGLAALGLNNIETLIHSGISGGLEKAIVVIVVTVITISIPKLCKLAYNWIVSKIHDHKSNRVKQGILSYITTTNDLKALVKDLGASRGILVKLHNGGHTPEVGKRLKLTVAAEWAPQDKDLIAGDWQDRPCGTDYIEDMISPLMSKEHFYLPTSDLKRQSPLRDMYTAQGVSGSYLWLLGASPSSESLYFLSFHFENDVEEDADLRHRIRSTALKIKEKLSLS